MQSSLSLALSSNLTLKIGAFVIGVTLWALVSSVYEETITVTVPLCFFNAENYAIVAPESLRVTLKGFRHDLRAIDYKALAAHLDAGKIGPGKRSVLVGNKELFLPKKIKLVSYSPMNLEVELTKK